MDMLPNSITKMLVWNKAGQPKGWPFVLLFTRLLFVFVLGSSSFQVLCAQPQQIKNLSGTFWLDLNLNLVVSPAAKNKPQYIQHLIEESQRFVLKEASYVFYGMIYGYQVVYRPSDRFHRQDETFVVTPRNPERIKPYSLDIYHIGQQGHRFYYSVRKPLSQFESSNILAWRQADKKTLQTSGAVDFAAASREDRNSATHNLEPLLMIELRKAAIDNAIKAAIRKYFRRKLRNKPAQIYVNLALSAVPKIAVGSGELIAKVQLHLGHYRIERYETR